MKLQTVFALLVVVLALIATSVARSVKVELKDALGHSVGTATISSSAGGVDVSLDLHGLPPGKHGIHFHENPKCAGPDFKSAGGHFNPEGRKHGFQNPGGHHAGDMTNITVDSNGKTKQTVKDNAVNLGSASDWHSLFANGGTTLVIHARKDDMKTDPSGNSGDRIVCGVIVGQVAISPTALLEPLRSSFAGSSASASLTITETPLGVASFWVQAINQVSYLNGEEQP